jgi:hypothetical protein
MLYPRFYPEINKCACLPVTDCIQSHKEPNHILIQKIFYYVSTSPERSILFYVWSLLLQICLPFLIIETGYSFLCNSLDNVNIKCILLLTTITLTRKWNDSYVFIDKVSNGLIQNEKL